MATIKRENEKDESPSLDDWMAKIREKKLRPVVPNQHKSWEKSSDKASAVAGPHDSNEILQMRQGLRSVSTPKWPGVNDHKAKTNTTEFPQRSQLRTVSERSTMVRTPAQLAEAQQIIDTKVSESEALAKNPDVEPDQPNTIPDDHDFLLDHENDTNKKLSNGSELLGASSGAIDPSATPELKLPEPDEADFPLDLEQPDAVKSPESCATPVTLSSGVFDTSVETVELKLPMEKDNTFPLDVEDASVETATVADDFTATSDTKDLDASTTTTKLTLPLIKKGTKDQLREVQEAQDEAVKDDQEKEEVPVEASVGVIDPTGPSIPVLDVPECKTDVAAPSVKCSTCAREVPLDSLDNHVCA